VRGHLVVSGAVNIASRGVGTTLRPRRSNSSMKTLRLLLLLPALLLGACAGVYTQVVPLNPARVYSPTQFVEVLLEKPTRPHVEIALIESRGESEAELLNDAREKARAIGADALVRVQTERFFHEPVMVYDPWMDPFYGMGYRRRHASPFGPWNHLGSRGTYHMTPGYFSYVLKATAVKFTLPAG